MVIRRSSKRPPTRPAIRRLMSDTARLGEPPSRFEVSLDELLEIGSLDQACSDPHMTTLRHWQVQRAWLHLARWVLGDWAVTKRAAMVLIVIFVCGTASLLAVLGMQGLAVLVGLRAVLPMASRRHLYPSTAVL